MKVKAIFFAVIVTGGLAVAALQGRSTSQNAPCLQIFFDAESEEQLTSGRDFAEKVAQLLRPYRAYQAKLKGIASYQSGDLRACAKNIYIGTHFDHRVPRVFVEDFMNARGSVAWFGYNIWQMGPRLEQEWGLRFIRMAQAERDGGFDEILYEGGVFRKALSATYGAQVELLPSNLSRFVILAESRNSVSREIIPYAIHSGNRFYFADVPELEQATEHVRLMLTEIFARFMEGTPTDRRPGKIIAASEESY